MMGTSGGTRLPGPEADAIQAPTGCALMYYVWCIGCQMNQADARRMEEALQTMGLAQAARAEQADLVVLITCVVRQSAEDRVLGRLHSLKSWRYAGLDRALAVMGCFVDETKGLDDTYPWVDCFLGPSDIEGARAFAEGWMAERGGVLARAGEPPAPLVSEMVPISYGCDHHCTYCIVTDRRGAQQSRPLDAILCDCRQLATRGAREVTLLGQNVDAYGTDLAEHPDLADVLTAVHDIQGLCRLRFLTSYPGDMTHRIVEAAARLPKVCECWELPAQSGDDGILRRMGRKYTVEQFLGLVERIRQRMPDCAVNTDIIVGFPGETVEAFEATVRLVERVRFDIVHVAGYSPRPGTPAARLVDDVPHEEKIRRREVIEELQTQVAGQINARLLGTDVEVLVDGRQRGRWRGRTRTNKLVFFEHPRDLLGQLVRPTVTWAGPWSLLGELTDWCP